MSTLAAFLLARVEEDEEAAKAARGSVVEIGGTDEVHAHFERWNAARVLAECAAKRALIEEIQSLEYTIDNEWGSGKGFADEESALRLLAQPYTSHPDFRPEWATNAQED